MNQNHRSPRAESRGLSLLVSLLAFAACAPAAPPLDKATYAAALGVDISASTAVSGMYIRDITEGTGAAAVVGSQITM